MRSAPEPVKLRIANVGGFHRLRPAAALAAKNPAKSEIFVAIATFQRSSIAAPRNIDENRTLPYKPANCPRCPGLTGGGSFGAAMAHFGPVSITGLNLNSVLS